MCAKCGCQAGPMTVPNGSSGKGGVVVKETDSKPGGYDYQNR